MHLKAIFALYRLVRILAFPFILLYFAARGLKNRKYFAGFRERLGRLPNHYRETPPGGVWLHAVSVGEVLSAVELVRRLAVELPGAPVFVSTTTLAGRAVAVEKLRGLAECVFFAPIDYCFAVRRVLRRLRPRAVVVLETEIWPVLWREARRAGCALLVVNGRISDRAMPRYRRMRWFFRHVLGLPQTILAQSEISAARYLELGAPPDRVSVAGNLKYDFTPKPAPEALRRWIERTAAEEVWIAASTMPPAVPGDPDEDQVVLDVFRALAPRHASLLLILAPRRPERFETAAALFGDAGVPLLRRSRLGEDDSLTLPGVLLLDTIGELGSLFPLADVVFMGGTLAHRGGHNVLEPAFAARPVTAGPHMENFPEIARKFSDGGGLVRISKAAELEQAVDKLLADPGLRARVGARALELAESERGAAGRAVATISRHYREALPRFLPPAPVAAVMWPLSRLWLLGGAWKRRRDLARQARLATPVISVGGLTAGGAGKTPLVLWLAQRLQQPAILTRGYRRRSTDPVTIVAPGDSVPASITGDEAQIYLLAGVAPVGIAADRAAAGRVIEKRFHPSVFLLDDGFQHHRLARALDIVVIDALDPFGAGELLPLGRLRETPEALVRADAVVVSRAGPGAEAVLTQIRRWNRQVPVFLSRVVPRGWIDAAMGAPATLPANTAAFCALGNPGSFWHTLAIAGVRPVFRRAFRDHHRYREAELSTMAREAGAAGAEALLTTAKDLMNLPERWQHAVAPLRLLWLETALEIDEGEELLALVEW